MMLTVIVQVSLVNSLQHVYPIRYLDRLVMIRNEGSIANKSFEQTEASATLLKKRLWHKCFSVNFLKFLRTPFLQNTSGRLVLNKKNMGIFTLIRYASFYFKIV